jgi:hypothetical protein
MVLISKIIKYFKNVLNKEKKMWIDAFINDDLSCSGCSCYIDKKSEHYTYGSQLPTTKVVGFHDHDRNG